jgi:hypothetical protein
MALRMGALYDALRLAPGIPESAAREAAEEVANYDNRLARIESDLRLLKWMVGVNVALSMAMFWQGFTIMGRLN